MKKIYTLVLLTCLSMQTFAQINYDLEVLYQPYENLKDTTQLSLQYELSNFDEGWTVPLGFNFHFIDRDFDEVEVLFNNLFFDYDDSYVFYSYFDDLIGVLPVVIDTINNDYNISPVSYKVEGEPGSKIFKIEYKYAGFAEDTCTLVENCSYVSFQTWLFEEDNSIEVHYGPNSVAQYVFEDSELFGTYCIIQESEDNFHFYTGDSTNPAVLTSEDPIPDSLGLWPSPADGTVYRFTPFTDIAVTNQKIKQIKVYPSPVQDILNIEGDDFGATQYIIYDLLGHEVSTNKMKNKINVAHLESGVYSISIYKNLTLVGVQKFVKI